MAEPFSFVTGAVGVAETCVRLVQNIQQLKREYTGIRDELDTLGGDVLALKDLCLSIDSTFTTKWSVSQPDKELSLVYPEFDTHLLHLQKALDNCSRVTARLNDVVLHIRGTADANSPSPLDVLVMAMRKKARQGDLQSCRDQLATCQIALHLVLSTITFQHMKRSQQTHHQSFKDLSNDVQRLDSNLQMRIASLRQVIMSTNSVETDMRTIDSLEQLRDWIRSGPAGGGGTDGAHAKQQKLNEFFDIPQSVSSIFTGRETLLRDLRDLLIPKEAGDRGDFQRRFIIHGLGGSGKTQFCCKFAEENRDSFWGVFWIDASSPDRITQTIHVIAETVKIHKNERAVLSYLSNLDKPWLLIIDNADDEGIPLDQYFPKGNRGTILITTRNRGYKLHGNVGPRYYSFHGLDPEEATYLLLKASDQPAPWDISCKSTASAISELLGSLALAIVQAGAAIRDRLCSLKDYPRYYKRSYDRLRQLAGPQGGSSSVSSSSSSSSSPSSIEAKVHATWEICHERLENKGSQAASDAIEILNVLAFFHSESITPTIFSRALKNPAQESMQDIETQHDNPIAASWLASSAAWIKSIPISLLMFLFRNSGPPPLPRVLRSTDHRGGSAPSWEDAEDRIRLALKELDQMSLIIRNDHSESYAMHPIIHVWARERPKMRLADQALWADVAGRILAASILLPPLGMSDEDDTYHMSLLPHVQHVQGCRKIIRNKMAEKLDSTDTFLAQLARSVLPVWVPDTDRIHMYAKFSLVYAKCGHWASAEPLLSEVSNFLHHHLGPAHSRSIRVALLLSNTYWYLGEPSRAADLQMSVLETCKKHLGPLHLDTLKAMGELARTRWQQGQYSVARELQEVVLRERLISLPPNHVDTLEAMDSLAMTVHKFWERADLERAWQLHSEAAEGMAEVHGRHHARTLVAIENQCRVAVLLGGEPASMAVDRMSDVLEARRQKLGEEHGYTLLAMVNMAIVLSAVGRLEEAQSLIRKGLPIAMRDYGEDHIGTLFAQSTLATILSQQGKYAEAEQILVSVADKQRHLNEGLGHHPDRLGALIELVRSLYHQGKIENAIAICDEAIEGFDIISSTPHPLAKSLRVARTNMAQQMRRRSLADDAADFSDDVRIPPVLWGFDRNVG